MLRGTNFPAEKPEEERGEEEEQIQELERRPESGTSDGHKIRKTRRRNEFIPLHDLPKLPRVEREQVIASTYKYSGPLTSMKIRVRLLEYPSKENGKKYKGNEMQMLKVVDDRTFGWQEKVHPPPSKDTKDKEGEIEGEHDIDHHHRRHWLFSYVDEDILAHTRLVTVRKEKVSAHQEQEGEGVGDWEDLGREEISLTSTLITSRTKEKTEEEKEKIEVSEADERKNKERERKLQERRQKGEDEIERRRQQLRTFTIEEQKRTQGILGKHSRTKRPSVSICSSLPPAGQGRRKSKAEATIAKSEKEDVVEERSSPQFQRRTTRAIASVKRGQAMKREISYKSMVIAANIPNTKRKVVVCRIMAFPSISTITFKTPFGFRVIHATRQNVYRLHWELHVPPEPGRKKPKLLHRPEKPYLQYGTGMGLSFETVGINEMHIFVMGEILSARGFDTEPLCVHYFLEIPKSQGWLNHNSSATYGTTHSSFTTVDGTAHFSENFTTQLSFSLDSLNSGDCNSVEYPLLFLMVLSIKENGRVRYEGYGYTKLPSTPGPHTIRIQTWKLAHRSIADKMQDAFLDVTSSMQDVTATHVGQTGDNNKTERVAQLCCKLGLKTESSGEITLRFHILHRSPSNVKDQASKLELLEKMSSATILKSVQTVIDAFNRARQKTLSLKNKENVLMR